MSIDPLKKCSRCKKVMKNSNINLAFDCCKNCVNDKDLDSLQPDITRLMRGFSAREKVEIMREAFAENKKRMEEALYGQKDKVSKKADGQKARQACCAG